MAQDTPSTAPSFRLDGKKALITGAGRGIGHAAARAMAAAGAEVWAASRTRSELDALAKQAPGQIHPLVMDVTDLDDARALIDQHGPFDILFNNAGGNRPAPFLEVNEADFDHVTQLNIKSAFFIAQAVAAGMVKAGIAGSIINVSSQMGHVGGSKRTVYCATKFAVEGMSKAMAADLAGHGIRVNTICPTFIETPMTAPFLADPALKAQILEKILLGRTGQVDDLTGAVIFLASNASALMTGSALMVDGGWTAV